jgi:hypothetical protein
MGLKGSRLWVMCQLDSTRRSPPSELEQAHQPNHAHEFHNVGSVGAAARGADDQVERYRGDDVQREPRCSAAGCI